MIVDATVSAIGLGSEIMSSSKTDRDSVKTIVEHTSVQVRGPGVQ